MDKRYQVFVSSTFKDLIEERRQITSILMKMNCIPAGMELFPAVDLEQFEFIKRIIDDSDYFIIMIAGKYGSISPEAGVSYTEMEYDYAIKKNKKIIALLHKDINTLTRDKIETDPEIAEKLEAFRDKASTNRLVNFWRNLDEIPGHIAVSLTQTITLFPSEGWVRSGNATTEQTLIELNELRKENDELRNALHSFNDSIPNLAKLSNLYKLSGTLSMFYGGRRDIINWEGEFSWEEIFSMIAATLISLTPDNEVRTLIAKYAASETKNAIIERNRAFNKKIHFSSFAIDNEVYDIVKIQLMTYQLVKVKSYKLTNGGLNVFWSLTDKGQLQMMNSMSVKE